MFRRTSGEYPHWCNLPRATGSRVPFFRPHTCLVATSSVPLPLSSQLPPLSPSLVLLLLFLHESCQCHCRVRMSLACPYVVSCRYLAMALHTPIALYHFNVSKQSWALLELIHPRCALCLALSLLHRCCRYNRGDVASTIAIAHLLYTQGELHHHHSHAQ